MITELNRVLIYLGSEIDKAKKEACITNEDYQYNNGYLQALLDVKERVLEIYHE